MIDNLCKKIARLCCCFKISILDTQDNDDYNTFENNNLENNVRVTDEKLNTSPTSFDNRYSLSDEAFTYSDVYR